MPKQNDLPRNGAISALIKAAREYCDSEERVARESFREWTGSRWKWHPSMWERADAPSYRKWRAVKYALEACELVSR
jgi:hypothetical protein